jgi:hypothetical protein
MPLPWPAPLDLDLEREAQEGSDKDDGGEHPKAPEGGRDGDRSNDVRGDEELKTRGYPLSALSTRGIASEFPFAIEPVRWRLVRCPGKLLIKLGDDLLALFGIDATQNGIDLLLLAVGAFLRLR